MYENGNPHSHHGDGALVVWKRSRTGETLNGSINNILYLPSDFLKQVAVYSFFVCKMPQINWKIGTHTHKKRDINEKKQNN